MESNFGIYNGSDSNGNFVAMHGMGILFYPKNTFEEKMFMAELELKCRALKSAELAATGERTGGGAAQPTGRSATCLCDPCIKLCSIRPFVVDGSVVLTNCNMIKS